MSPAPPKPTVMAGKTKVCKLPDPDTGNQPIVVTDALEDRTYFGVGVWTYIFKVFGIIAKRH